MSESQPLRSAAVIAVGSELLGIGRIDSNSLFLAGELDALGIELRGKSVVGDDRLEIASLFQHWLDRVDLVVFTGGLGPTDDDLTRDVVAEVLQRPLEEDAAIVERIAQRFARRGMRMPEVNRKQAQVPRGATVLENPNGTAPGLLIGHRDQLVILLPGPPREMQPMVKGLAAGILNARAGNERIYRASLFITGRSESHVEEIAQPIYSRWRAADRPIETTILASPGQIELHVCVRHTDPVAGRQTAVDARDELARAVGADVFSLDERTMEEVVGELLRERALTIAVAESCSGGLLTSRLTDVPGSSAYVLAAVVAYSNAAKVALAGVPDDLIAAHGAVSEAVAVALAEGVRAIGGASIGVGVTGIAGPGGGSPEKPVGTVCVAVVGPDGTARVRTFWFPGGRAQIKFFATQAALDMVRRLVQGA
jgi:nicotinamide-nucleotide amidase